MNFKNLGNPLYWAGKELSKEGYFLVLRWFYVAFIGEVGRESMALYGGHHCQREKERESAWICYRLFQLTEQWGGPLSSEWCILIDFMTNQITLEPEVKLQILSRCSRHRYPKDLKSHVLQTRAAKKMYVQALNNLQKLEPQLTDKTTVI